MEKTEETDTLRIDIEKDVKCHFTAAHKRYGLNQREAVTRLIRWWSEQTDIVQTLVMGTLPAELHDEAMRLALDEINSRRQAPAEPPEDGVEYDEPRDADDGDKKKRRRKPG